MEEYLIKNTTLAAIANAIRERNSESGQYTTSDMAVKIHALPTDQMRRDFIAIVERNPKSISIPDGATSIGNSVFYGCSGLTSIVIPGGVTSIDSYAFYGCSGLTSIVIPDSVTSIGSYAFQKCSGLTSIVIPDSVTSIGTYAFQNCSGLTTAEVRAQKLGTGTKIFYNCSRLNAVWIRSTCLTITASSVANAPFANCPSSLKIYAEPTSKLSGWGTYFNRTGTSGTMSAAVIYGKTTCPW